jgi:hypothetical protein
MLASWCFKIWKPSSCPALGVTPFRSFPYSFPEGDFHRPHLLYNLPHYCPYLSGLKAHFQVGTLEPPEIPGLTSTHGSTSPLRAIHVPEESASRVASALLIIFLYLSEIDCYDKGWEKVFEAIKTPKRFLRSSSKKSLIIPRFLGPFFVGELQNGFPTHCLPKTPVFGPQASLRLTWPVSTHSQSFPFIRCREWQSRGVH